MTPQRQMATTNTLKPWICKRCGHHEADTDGDQLFIRRKGRLVSLPLDPRIVEWSCEACKHPVKWIKRTSKMMFNS